MTLTVPTAGTIAGRAAQTMQRPALQFGQAAAQIGAGIEGLAARMIASRVEYATQEATLNMTTDFAAARQKVDQLTDPSQIGPAWDQATAEIRAKYLPIDQKGNSILDPREEANLQLAFTDLSGKHAIALADNTLRLGQTQQRAAWMATRERITTQAVTADPQTAESLLEVGNARIDAMVKDGTLDPAEAEAERQGLRQSVAAVQADKLIGSDPQAFLDQVKAGTWNDLGADGLQRGQAAATAALAQQQKAAEDAATRAAKQATAAANDQLDAMIGLSAKGVSPAQRGLLADPTFRAAADPGKLAQADNAVRLVDEIPTIGQMSVPDLKAAIAAEAAKPKTDAWQTQKLDLMQARLNERQAALTKDGAAFLQAQGTGFAPLPAFDPVNPSAFEAALKARVVDATHYSETEGVQIQPLTIEEQAQLKAMTAPTADPKSRAALAGILGRNFGQASAAALTGDRTFAWVSGLSAAGAPPALAAEILKGQSRATADNVVLPPVSDRLQGAYDTLGATVSDMAGDPAMADALKAADYLYVARKPNPADAKVIDQDAYAQALHEVLGGTGTYGSAEARGGIQIVRWTETLMPMGVQGAEVETRLDNLSASDPAAIASILTAISESGQAPMIHSLPVGPADLADVHIEAIAGNLYRFVTEAGTTFETGAGTEYRFRLLPQGSAAGLLGAAP